MSKRKKLLNLLREFGFIFTIKYCYFKIIKNNKKLIDIIYKYLENILQPTIEKYVKESDYENSKGTSLNIWVCWWQGEKSMPEFCKMCYENLLLCTPKEYKIHLVTEKNYKDYVMIPEYIITKVEQGKISFTLFSDILREALLAQNGGIWIDSSVWVTKNYTNLIDLEKDFWSIKLEHIYDNNVLGQLISECKWSGFILGGKKDSIVYEYLFDSMKAYFERFDYPIDYFLQNVILRIGYDNIPKIKELIDAVDYSNPNLYTLYDCMDKEFDNKEWKELCHNTGLFKLSQKRQYVEEINGKVTYYGFIKQSVNKKLQLED